MPKKKQLQRAGSLRAEITITMDDADVERLIGQDPMGALDKPLKLSLNGFDFVAQPCGYAACNGEAHLTLTIS